MRLLAACIYQRCSAGPEGLLKAEQADRTSRESPEISPGHRLVTMPDATYGIVPGVLTQLHIQGLRVFPVLWFCRPAVLETCPTPTCNARPRFKGASSAESMLWSLLAERLPAASMDAPPAGLRLKLGGRLTGKMFVWASVLYSGVGRSGRPQHASFRHLAFHHTRHDVNIHSVCPASYDTKADTAHAWDLEASAASKEASMVTDCAA